MKAHLTWLLPAAAFVIGWFLNTSPAPLASGQTAAVDRPTAAAPASAELPPSLPPDPPALVSARREVASVPIVSLREALDYRSELHRLAAFDRLVGTMNAGQLSSLHAELTALGPEVDWRLWARFYERWVQVAPEAAALAAMKNSDHISPALVAWAKRDPLAALAWADERQAKIPYAYGYRMLRDSLVGAAIPKPGQYPPAEALRRILALQHKDHKGSAIHNGMAAIMADWTKKDPEAAWQGALDLEPATGSRADALGMVVCALVDDPARCQQLVASLPEEAERNKVMKTYAMMWAWKDASAARRYALALPEGETRRAAAQGVAYALQSSKPEVLGSFMTSLKATDFADPAAYSDVFMSWFRSEPARAGEVLLANLPSDLQLTDEQQEGYRRMFFWWTDRNPQAAADYILKLPESIRAGPLSSAVDSMVFKDAPAAAQWAAGIEDSATRDLLLKKIATKWSGRSITEAAQWLNTLPTGAVRSAAVEGFAEAIISSSPDDALAWLRSVPEEKDRLRRLNDVWSKWADREAAIRWRDTTPGLTATERAAMREP
jgi:hypothetical protein